MSYRFEFANVATGERFMVRARDVEAAIHYVETTHEGIFDCLAQYRDADPAGEPLMCWPPGERR